MYELDLTNETIVGWVTREFGLPEGFIASLSRSNRLDLEEAMCEIANIEIDQGNFTIRWDLQFVLCELRAKIERFKEDYEEESWGKGFDKDEMLQFAMREIDDAIRLFEKLLPIYTAQKLKEIERWKKYAFEAYRITEEDLINKALGEAA